MSVYEAVFLLSFVAVGGITIAKLYNLLSGAKIYSFVTGLLLFAGYLLLWFLNLIVLLANPTEILYILSFRLLSLILVLNLVFTIAEMFYAINERAQEMIKPHNAREQLAFKSKV